VILDRGMREMMVEQKDVFYYVTLMNENYAQPDLRPGAEADIIRGCYRFDSFLPAGKKVAGEVTLMGSGAILTEVIKAAQQLAQQGITATVFSVTSWSELARDGAAKQQAALSGEAHAEAFVARQLKASTGPIIAATDYVRAVPESIRAFLPEGRRYLTLGTDGFGRSDTRAALRDFFSVDAQSIAKAALHLLKPA
jgi:pyruvate dehydrogenase E1 component